MFDKSTRAFLRKYLPRDYRSRVHKRLKKATHPTQISHVRSERRMDLDIAKVIVQVAKEEKRRRDRLQRSIQIKP